MPAHKPDKEFPDTGTLIMEKRLNLGVGEGRKDCRRTDLPFYDSGEKNLAATSYKRKSVQTLQSVSIDKHKMGPI